MIFSLSQAAVTAADAGFTWKYDDLFNHNNDARNKTNKHTERQVVSERETEVVIEREREEKQREIKCVKINKINE